MLRKKYRKEREELLNDLKSKSIQTKVLNIELKALSKVKDHFLYECIVLDQSKIKTIPIIAKDVTQALAKLEPYVNLSIPEETLKAMLGNERFVN